MEYLATLEFRQTQTYSSTQVFFLSNRNTIKSSHEIMTEYKGRTEPGKKIVAVVVVVVVVVVLH